MTKQAAFAALCLIATSCVMVFCALSFARAQAIWVDETTQLSGLTLGFAEQVSWLFGRMEHPFTVPADRMPPLSYWLGRIWANVFGLTEDSLRFLGIVAGVCAMPALFLAGRRVGGLLGGLFAVAFLFTSPSFVIQTVEIRAYPVFFCLSAWATCVFVHIVTQEKGTDDRRAMIALTVLLVTMSYTHFYGVVASAFFFLALLVFCLSAQKPVKMLLICGAVGIILLAGVVPFVLRSVTMTGSATVDASGLYPALADALRLTFRLLTSPVLFARPFALGVALGGIVLLGSCLVLALLSRQQPWPRKTLLIILLPLVTGLVGLTLIRTQVSTFAILAPHYNLWLWPLASTALACTFALQGLWIRRVVHVAAACVIAAQLAGLATLMTHKTLYSHGPAEAIAAQIDSPDTTLVVHDAEGLWAQSYFPLSYLTDGKMVQWLAYPDGRYERITKPGLVAIADPEAEQRTFKQVLYVQTGELDSMQLARITQDAQACHLAPTHLMATQKPEDIRTFCGYISALHSTQTQE